MREWMSRCGRALRDVWHGASGLHEYENYRDHCRRHHPEQKPLTQEEFFRQQFTERWQGVRRCC